MDLSLDISNFRSIEKLSLPIRGITLIGGFNAAGKSSIATAVQSVIKATAMPYDWMKKQDVKALLNDGAAGNNKRGKVSLIAESGQRIDINYPGGTVSGEKLLSASDFALGIQSIPLLKPKDSAGLLMEYMQAKPTKDDLAEATTPEIAEKIWPAIQETSWDAAFVKAKDSGTKLKGQWEGLTNENYGSKKAQGWLPEGIDREDIKNLDDLKAQEQQSRNTLSELHLKKVDPLKVKDLTQKAARAKEIFDYMGSEVTEDLTPALQAAEATYNDIHGKFSVSQDHTQQLLQELKELPKLRLKLTELSESSEKDQSEIKDCQEAIKLLDAKLKELPKVSDEGLKSTPCPCCKEQLVIVGENIHSLSEIQGQVEVYKQNADPLLTQRSCNVTLIEQKTQRLNDTKTQKRELESRIQALEKAEAEQRSQSQDAVTAEQVDAAREAVKTLQTKIALQKEYPHIQNAQAELDTLPKESPKEEEIQAAEQSLNEVLKNQRITELVCRTDAVYRQICTNQTIQDALAPSGVRQSVVAKALGDFNQQLSDMSSKSGWGQVQIEPDLTVTYSGRHYQLLSESEQFRTRVALQILMSEIDGSQILVIDAADILDKSGRNGLIRLLVNLNKPVILTMTFSEQSLMPDLSKLRGHSVWIS